MLKPTMKVKGVKKLLNKLSAASQDRTIKRGLKTSAIFIVGWVREKRLTGTDGAHRILRVDSGRLRGSIHNSRVVKRGGIYVAPIGTRVKYAKIHEFGGTILPKRGRFLSWVDRGTKKRIFARKVKMPARPFLRPALRDRKNRQEVLEILTHEITKAMKRTRQ